MRPLRSDRLELRIECFDVFNSKAGGRLLCFFHLVALGERKQVSTRVIECFGYVDNSWTGYKAEILTRNVC